MENLKSECKKIIDQSFADQVYVRTGNKMEDQAALATLMSDISEKAIDNCVDYLNTQNPEIANEFAKSGFISVYLKEKQKEFLEL